MLTFYKNKAKEGGYKVRPNGGTKWAPGDGGQHQVHPNGHKA